jgi:deoxycytidylate deaminase
MFAAYDFTKNSHHKQEKYMRRAAKIATKSNCVQQQHGCIIVNRKTDEIVSEGYNHYTKHSEYCFTCHSEVDAINKIKKYPKQLIKDLDLYVVRIGPNEALKYSKPCSGCARAISKFGIKRAYFSTDEDYLREMRDLGEFDHKPMHNRRTGLWRGKIA